MNYILLTPLKNAALVKTALLLYSDCDIESVIRRLGPIHDIREQVEMKVAEKLSSLLPPPFFKSVAEVILYMHYEVRSWKENHRFLLDDIGPSCYAWLCWKMNGTINRIQTAKKIVGNLNIDAKIRFITACTYFLEEEVTALWERFSAVDKMEVYRGDTNVAVRFWMKWLNKKNNKHWSEIINEPFGIQNVQAKDIPLRLGSFYHFLSWDNKKRYLREFDCGMSHSDDFQECVNKMHEAERTEMFNSNSELALQNFLKWPFRSVFLKMANNLLHNLTPHEFSLVLGSLLHTYVFYGHEDFEILEEFWQMRPAALKERTETTTTFIAMPNVELERYPKIFDEIRRSVFDEMTPRYEGLASNIKGLRVGTKSKK